MAAKIDAKKSLCSLQDRIHPSIRSARWIEWIVVNMCIMQILDNRCVRTRTHRILAIPSAKRIFTIRVECANNRPTSLLQQAVNQIYDVPIPARTQYAHYQQIHIDYINYLYFMKWRQCWIFTISIKISVDEHLVLGREYRVALEEQFIRLMWCNASALPVYCPDHMFCISITVALLQSSI